MKIFYRQFKKVKNNTTLTNIIHHNFSYISQFPELSHNKHEIKKILENENSLNIILYHENSVIGYVLGEYKILNDSRQVYYISYWYILKKYRSKGIGTLLMKIIINKCKQNNIRFITLTCDTHDKQILNFYSKFGFSIDNILTNNERHKVFTLFIN